MNDQIEKLISIVAELREKDVSHPELGTASNFEDAQTSKQRLLAYLDGILGLALQLRDQFNRAVMESSLVQVDKTLNAVRNDVTNIEEAVAAGIHTPEFPTKRTSFLKATADRLRQSEAALHPFETALRLAKLERVVTDDAGLRQTRGELEAVLAEVGRAKAEIEKALSNVRDRITQTSVKDAESGFGQLAAAHASREKAWFVAFLIAAAALAVSIGWAVTSSLQVATLPAALVSIFRKILVITTAAVFVRLALGKYNAERNLRIIYDHRGAVLGQYTLFESAIGDDADGRVAKNQFRLELAKYIFTDPATGYISSEAAADININPVISMIEKFGPKT
jgi:hypothetical protein